MLTIIYFRNDHGVHEVRIAGIQQTIAVQPRFFAKVTGASPNAIAGIITDVSAEMADELGFIVNRTEGAIAL
ncbi:hypothetical protein [Paenibacillus naphthalenovorans]|uniref:hypothetical protein n=1 Tax=Paenibacillus naphthalenovorans TaxID=162209 RepID=UPI003D2D00EB